MFEGNLVESRGLVASRTQKWSAIGSVALQCALAALLIAIPMFRPEMLPTNVGAPKITVPNLRPVHLVQRVTDAAATAVPTINIPASAPTVERTRGMVFPTAQAIGDSDPAPIGAGPMAMGNGQGSIASLVGIASVGVAAVAHVRDNRPVRVSQGVSNGMLLTPIVPAYPVIAKAARVQGTVVIEAVISKAGRVESLNVVSGPEMLRGAALDAVRQARYAPYKLNGEPVDVQTVITVVFRMG